MIGLNLINMVIKTNQISYSTLFNLSLTKLEEILLRCLPNPNFKVFKLRKLNIENKIVFRCLCRLEGQPQKPPITYILNKPNLSWAWHSSAPACFTLYSISPSKYLSSWKWRNVRTSIRQSKASSKLLTSSTAFD